jgi:L-aminopeptidase/D-esterase-like protein
MKLDGSITDVPGIKVGHADNPHALTGCTVILCEEGAVAGVDQHGGAPGTRETDLLRPMHLVEKAHAVLLSGGSAFGLDAAGGVMRYLEENGIGVDTGVVRVPIVPAAILFDLDLGESAVRPDSEMGYQACLNASTLPVRQGNAGAGMGARVGTMLGIEWAVKSGIGCASIDLDESVVLGAIFAVNAFGDVIDPETNQILAGARLKNEKTAGMKQTDYFANTLEIMRSQAGKENFKYFSSKNTVVGVLATNVELNVEQVNKLAQTAQDGLARVIRPAHTMFDGDTIFALSIGNIQLDANIVQAFAAEVTASAILNAVRYAEPAGGLPAASKFLDVR